MNAFSVYNNCGRSRDTYVLTLHPDQASLIGRQWDEDDTVLLLSCLEKHGTAFRDKVKKRKQIWIEISAQLVEHGYPWSSDDCRKKWSNLIRTFKVTYDAKNDLNTTKKSRWMFYDRMLALFMSPIGQYLPEVTTLIPVITQTSCPVRQGECTEETSLSIQDEQLPSSIFLHQTVEQDVAAQLENFMTSEVIATEFGTDIEVLTEPDQIARTTADTLIEIHNVDSFTDRDHSLQCGIEPNQLHSSEETSFILTPVDSVPVSLPPLHISTVPIYRKPKLVRGKDVKNKNSQKRKYYQITGPDCDLTAQLISITLEHNDKVLTQMKEFHQETLAIMRERNQTLRDLCDVLKQK